jgi:hypothetical protein
LQFSVLNFGLLQDAKIGISILPERKVLIAGAGLTGGIALQRVGTPKFEVRNCSTAAYGALKTIP